MTGPQCRPLWGAGPKQTVDSTSLTETGVGMVNVLRYVKLAIGTETPTAHHERIGRRECWDGEPRLGDGHSTVTVLPGVPFSSGSGSTTGQNRTVEVTRTVRWVVTTLNSQ